MGTVMHMLPNSGPFRPLIYWHLSMRCNLACAHCWVESSPHVDTTSDLTPGEIQVTIARLKELNPLRIVLSGGEPIVRPDFKQIIRAMIEHRIAFSVETNAVLITDEITALFASAMAQNVYCWISVSLDGGTQEAHEQMRGPRTFARTLKGIERLRNLNVPFSVQMVISDFNVDTIPRFFQIGRDYGVNSGNNVLSFSILAPIGRGKEMAEELANSFDQHLKAYRLIVENLKSYDGHILMKVPPATIPVGYMQHMINNPKVKFLVSCRFPLLGILPDGALSVCAMTGRTATLILGHLYKNNLADIIAQKIEPLREPYRSAQLEGICSDCIFKASCLGSCRAYAYMETGSFRGAHPLCEALDRAGLFPNIYRISRQGGMSITQVPTTPCVSSCDRQPPSPSRRGDRVDGSRLPHWRSATRALGDCARNPPSIAILPVVATGVKYIPPFTANGIEGHQSYPIRHGKEMTCGDRHVWGDSRRCPTSVARSCEPFVRENGPCLPSPGNGRDPSAVWGPRSAG